MQTIEMGDLRFALDDALEWHDDEGTLVAYLPGTDFANLRVTLLTIADDRDRPIAGGGTRTLRREAEKGGLRVMESGDTLWCHYTEPSSDGAPGSTMHYWYAGLDAYFLIVSCFVEAAMADDAQVKFVLGTVPGMIASVEVA